MVLVNVLERYYPFSNDRNERTIRSGAVAMPELPADSTKESRILTRESGFQFACHADLPCFTQCCRDVNIYLTPYDVLRLRRALRMGSQEFLSKHTHQFVSRITHVPLVQLAMDERTLSCKLVSDSGCQVYGDRPWACRMYPLDVADQDGHYRFFVGRESCYGLGEKRAWTVQQWLDDQGVAPYLRMDHEFQQVKPAGLQPGQRMDARLGELMFLAYDLDGFARLAEDPHFRKLMEVDDEMLSRLRQDNEALLLLAFRFIRAQLETLM
jgi:uncharacterized protein